MSELWNIQTIQLFIKIAIVVIVGGIGAALVKRVIYRAFRIAEIDVQRITPAEQSKITIVKLIVNTLQYIICFVIITLLFDLLGGTAIFVTIAATLGFTVSIIARDFVVDVITGVFVVGEKQFQVGDTIEVGGKSGLVTRIGLRTTTFIGEQGETITCANRVLTMVTTFDVQEKKQNERE